MAGLWTEVCLSMAVIDALADGYEVYIVTDAAGGGSTEGHERGVQRMVQAGAQPLTTIAYVSELQRDWARPTADEVAKLFAEHGGGFGQALGVAVAGPEGRQPVTPRRRMSFISTAGAVPQGKNESVIMKHIDEALTVDVRNGLPDELLELLRKYPRDQWANDARLHGLAEGWLQRHNLFRELSVLTGGMTTDLREGRTSPTTFLPLFQRRMGLLLGELDMHHRVEDDYYFPTFAAAASQLQNGFDILDNDHGAIHSLGTASRELIAALSGEVSGRDGDAPRVAERLAGEIEGFDRTLLRHLEDEELLIIPLILERTRDDPNFR